MELSYKPTMASVYPIQLDHPPAGLLVLRAPQDIALLTDDKIEAAILPSQNQAAIAYLCDNLEAALAHCPPSLTNKRFHTQKYIKYDIDYRYKSIGGVSTAPKPRISPLDAKPYADHPLWQAAVAEVTATTDALAAAFIGNAQAPYIEFHAVRWIDTAKSGRLHTDTAWQLTATQCKAPTVVEIGGRQHQGPDYCLTAFKGNRVWHRADRRDPASPEHPRVQLCWDIGRSSAESLLR